MNTSERNTVNEYLDLAIPELLEDEQYWRDEKRWTFGSLPDIELLDLYGLQFVAYKKTTGLYDTMMDYATEMSSNVKAEIAMEREKCQRKSFWKRIRKYLRKRVTFVRRLFNERH